MASVSSAGWTKIGRNEERKEEHSRRYRRPPITADQELLKRSLRTAGDGKTREQKNIAFRTANEHWLPFGAWTTDDLCKNPRPLRSLYSARLPLPLSTGNLSFGSNTQQKKMNRIVFFYWSVIRSWVLYCHFVYHKYPSSIISNWLWVSYHNYRKA